MSDSKRYFAAFQAWFWGLASLTQVWACNVYDEGLLLGRTRARGPASDDAGAIQAVNSVRNGTMDGSIGGRRRPSNGVQAESDGAVTEKPDRSGGTGGTMARDAAVASAPDARMDTPEGGELHEPRPDDDAGEACDNAALADVCNELHALPDPPVIDGELDCAPDPQRLSTQSWNGRSALPADHEATVTAAFRNDGLYVYVEVRGETPAPHPANTAIHCGSAVELYIDADGTLTDDGSYDQPGGVQLIIAAPASSTPQGDQAERFLEGTLLGPWRSGAFATTWRADGYAVEAFIEAADLGLTTWNPDARIGLDVAVGVGGSSDDPNVRCGHLLGQYFLRVASAEDECDGEPWCTTKAFCTPQLL